MAEKKQEKVEFIFNGRKREYSRNVDRLYKDGGKIDVNYELERILMGLELQEGDSVMIKVEINKNGKGSYK